MSQGGRMPTWVSHAYGHRSNSLPPCLSWWPGCLLPRCWDSNWLSWVSSSYTTDNDSLHWSQSLTTMSLDIYVTATGRHTAMYLWRPYRTGNHKGKRVTVNSAFWMMNFRIDIQKIIFMPWKTSGVRSSLCAWQRQKTQTKNKSNSHCLLRRACSRGH